MDDRLRQSQKMESVGHLVSGIAHDFNNVLQVIVAHADGLKSATPEDDPRAASIAEILNAVEYAQSLTRQLGEFVQRQPAEPRSIAVNDVIDGIYRMLRRTLPADIEISVATREGIWPVHVDPHAIEQMLVNLALNARDAMPGGGRLTIKAENIILDNPTGQLLAGCYVAISVTDNGAGMSPEQLERAGEPFFTTKQSGQGAGLGLSNCADIVRQAGGDITIDSASGVGTRVALLLPRAAVAERTPQHRDAGDTLEGSETILVVEDNPIVLRSTTQILSKRGYRVMEASNGDQALRLIQNYGPTIDLVLSDIVMPHMSGVELAERLDISHPNLKLILTTGYAHGAPGSETLATSDRALLAKPYSPRELLRRIRGELDAKRDAPVAMARWRDSA
jgi:CheY-like chemotaxis protein